MAQGIPQTPAVWSQVPFDGHISRCRWQMVLVPSPSSFSQEGGRRLLGAELQQDSCPSCRGALGEACSR